MRRDAAPIFERPLAIFLPPRIPTHSVFSARYTRFNGIEPLVTLPVSLSRKRMHENRYKEASADWQFELPLLAILVQQSQPQAAPSPAVLKETCNNFPIHSRDRRVKLNGILQRDPRILAGCVTHAMRIPFAFTKIDHIALTTTLTHGRKTLSFGSAVSTVDRVFCRFISLTSSVETHPT